MGKRSRTRSKRGGRRRAARGGVLVGLRGGVRRVAGGGRRRGRRSSWVGTAITLVLVLAAVALVFGRM